MKWKLLRPHVWMALDLRWVGVRAGVGHYDMSSDVFRPAFVDIILWERWRVSFEFGRASRLYR